MDFMEELSKSKLQMNINDIFKVISGIYNKF